MNIPNSYCDKRKHHLHLATFHLLFNIALFTRLFLLYSNVHKKQAFKCLFKVLLWREIDNASFLFFDIPSKNLKWNQHFYTETTWNHYFKTWLFGGTADQRSHKKRKDNLEAQAPYCWYFCVNLKFLGCSYRKYIKTAKMVVCSEYLLWGNDFYAAFVIFHSYR